MQVPTNFSGVVEYLSKTDQLRVVQRALGYVYPKWQPQLNIWKLSNSLPQEKLSETKLNFLKTVAYTGETISHNFDIILDHSEMALTLMSKNCNYISFTFQLKNKCNIHGLKSVYFDYTYSGEYRAAAVEIFLEEYFHQMDFNPQRVRVVRTEELSSIYTIEPVIVYIELTGRYYLFDDSAPMAMESAMDLYKAVRQDNEEYIAAINRPRSNHNVKIMIHLDKFRSWLGSIFK